MVSIIIPVYNAAPYILSSLDSVLGQTYKDWECILVDDRSTDDSREIIQAYIEEHPDVRIRLEVMPENSGASAARNRGLELAQGRYIAFLDADDLWYPKKLAKSLDFMDKQGAGFVFTAYAFADENAKPNGKIVRVPDTLHYREALSRTIIFTSTVLVDTKKIDRSLLRMPHVPSEDTATWWNILRQGHVAYGLDQPLTIYRRPQKSLSSDKKTAVKRIWNLYRNVEHLGRATSALCFVRWAFRATVRRFVDDAVRAHFEAIKRFTVLQLSLIGLLFHTAIYGIFWFQTLYPELSRVRFSQKGYNLGIGLTLWFRGHILILLIYFFLLAFLSKSAGGMRTGYLKPGNVFSSEVTALVLTNVFTYFQLSLMRNWLLSVKPFLTIFGLQVVVALAWSFLSDQIYRHVFPPRETLVVAFEECGEILEKFATRKDRFNITNVISVEKGNTLEAVKREVLRWYGGILIVGGDDESRKTLLEYCYRRFIRVYLVPEISDLLVQGADSMDLFDTPILELKEYTIRWETRLIKRTLDIIISFFALLLSSPYHLYKVLRQGRGEGDVLCMGKDGKPFMKHGKGLINVLLGSMSLVGPHPTPYEVAKEQIEKDERFYFRYRIKPGLLGMSQIYGKEDTSEEDRYKLDLYYILHYSVLGDIKLLLQFVRF